MMPDPGDGRVDAPWRAAASGAGKFFRTAVDSRRTHPSYPV